MKNVMIIDGAMNCAYDIFAATDAEFALFFPADGQDVAFADEIWGDDEDNPPAGLTEAFENLWKRPVAKPDVNGIHGIIFYQLDFKKTYYPNRRDSDLTQNLSRAQR